MAPASADSIARELVRAAQALRREVDVLSFASPITHVYNPLDYAWDLHRDYLRTYANSPKRTLFLGMNPGPFGMAQTGIPFGEVQAVRSWLKLSGTVRPPAHQHPKRPVLGLDCPRSEVSGARLWGLFAQRYPNARNFFRCHLVLNYCPLAFLEGSGRNRTPDKLPAAELTPLLESCDRHLRRVVELLQPTFLVGVGQFAYQRLEQLFSGASRTIGAILHPSPASPAANRNWAQTATRQLEELGVW